MGDRQLAIGHNWNYGSGIDDTFCTSTRDGVVGDGSASYTVFQRLVSLVGSKA